ncbi:hypothetical protein [Solibacillus sp. FSL H8-0538]|uniref:hypothetical protein n=1 Tax=Solibacillus sp. FSL H8-0538 TaxID=2921400 RepID=UPI0030F9D0F6
MNKLEWLENLQTMSDEELQKFAQGEGLSFSLKEIKKLRKLFQNASVTWLFTGIPEDVFVRANGIIGEDRLKRLQRLLL